MRKPPAAFDARPWLFGWLTEYDFMDDQLQDALISLPTPVRRGRNSLIAAAEAIRTLIAAERQQRVPA